jgi:hypothetical protein
MNNSLRGRRAAVTALLCASTLGVAACGSSPSSSPTVPAAPGAAKASTGNSGGRASSAAVAAAVRCIRDHGIPAYQDPVITPSGSVYTDSRSFDDAPDSTRRAVGRACQTLMTRASMDPGHQPPAPAALVQAGVKTAQCARAHGLPAMKDPNSEANYTPGHGFGHTAAELPGGKDSPGFASFRQACRAEIDAEMKASTLASLGGHGS